METKNNLCPWFLLVGTKITQYSKELVAQTGLPREAHQLPDLATSQARPLPQGPQHGLGKGSLKWGTSPPLGFLLLKPRLELDDGIIQKPQAPCFR